jgi:hypothetical protein
MKRTNLYLTEKQLERLHSRAEQEGLAVAELVRRAVDAFLAWDDPTYTPMPQPRNKEVALHPPLERRGLSCALRCKGYVALINELCDTEVGEQDTPILVAQEIVRFDVAVNQMLLMSVIESGCDLLEDHDYTACW